MIFKSVLLALTQHYKSPTTDGLIAYAYLSQQPKIWSHVFKNTITSCGPE